MGCAVRGRCSDAHWSWLADASRKVQELRRAQQPRGAKSGARPTATHLALDVVVVAGARDARGEQRNLVIVQVLDGLLKAWGVRVGREGGGERGRPRGGVQGGAGGRREAGSAPGRACSLGG